MSTVAEETTVPFIARADIESRAADVLRAHSLDFVPIDPVILANRLGISVYNAKFSDDGLVGMIAKKGDAVTILVNEADRPYRKRFTIAHELGHHFLHLLEDGEFVDGEANLFRQPHEPGQQDPDTRREIQANMFGAALLMPEDLVREEWAKFKSIEPMARRFNVSESAMGIRLDQLGLS